MSNETFSAMPVTTKIGSGVNFDCQWNIHWGPLKLMQGIGNNYQPHDDWDACKNWKTFPDQIECAPETWQAPRTYSWQAQIILWYVAPLAIAFEIIAALSWINLPSTASGSKSHCRLLLSKSSYVSPRPSTSSRYIWNHSWPTYCSTRFLNT